jgi:hypothetical protein
MEDQLAGSLSQQFLQQLPGETDPLVVVVDLRTGLGRALGDLGVVHADPATFEQFEGFLSDQCSVVRGEIVQSHVENTSRREYTLAAEMEQALV